MLPSSARRGSDELVIAAAMSPSDAGRTSCHSDRHDRGWSPAYADAEVSGCPSGEGAESTWSKLRNLAAGSITTRDAEGKRRRTHVCLRSFSGLSPTAADENGTNGRGPPLATALRRRHAVDVQILRDRAEALPLCVLVADASDDLNRENRLATGPPRCCVRSLGLPPSFREEALYLVDGDESRACAGFDRLDERQDALAERGAADAERCGCLGARVRELLDVGRFADDDLRVARRGCWGPVPPRLLVSVSEVAAGHGHSAYSNRATVLHLGASASRLLSRWVVAVGREVMAAG
jgi:hypothetical protein